MTAALLRYRPRNIHLLCNMLSYESKAEAKGRFLGDTLCYILKANAPKFERETYSAFCERLDGHAKAEDNRTGSEIINDLIAKWEGK